MSKSRLTPVLKGLNPIEKSRVETWVPTDREGLVVRVRDPGPGEGIPVTLIEDLTEVEVHDETSGAWIRGRAAAQTTPGWPVTLIKAVERIRAEAERAMVCPECDSYLILRDRDLECAECGLCMNPDCPNCGGRTALRYRKLKGQPADIPPAFWACRDDACASALLWGQRDPQPQQVPDKPWTEHGEREEQIAEAREVLDHPLVSEANAVKKLRVILDENPDRVLPLVLGETTPSGKKTVQARLEEKLAEERRQGKPRRRVKRRAQKARRVQPGEKREGIKYYGPEDSLPGPSGTSLVEVPEDDETSVASSVYPHHRLAHAALNPIQSRVLDVYDRNCNVVIAASTSAGKTLSAEMVMGDALDRGAKAIFLAPLRAVSQEKYDDWCDEDHPWSELGVEICTGDYTMSQAKRKALRRADVIVMTSEMLDSKTRRMGSDENGWLMETLCVVGSSGIALADGTTKTIKEIVEERLEIEVLAFNHSIGKVVKRRVTGWHKNRLGDRNLVEITCGTASLTCTEDHEIYQRGVGYTAARKLTSSSTLEVLDAGQEGTQIRREAHGRADGHRAIGCHRDTARRQLTIVGNREPGKCQNACEEQPRTAGVRVVEVRDASASCADSSEGGAESWIQARRNGIRIFHEVLRRGPTQDQTIDRTREDGDARSAGLVDGARGTGRVVHGRRIEVEGGESRTTYTVNDCRRGAVDVALAQGGVEYRDQADVGQEQSLRGATYSGGIRRAVYGYRETIRDRDNMHGAQGIAQERVAVLHDVRHRVRGNEASDPARDETCHLPVRGLHEGPSPYDSETERREDRFVYDLTVEGEHNYFAEGVLVHNCVVVDEAHLLTMKDRGDALECGLERFTRFNPHARIVLLSATMPNVHELGSWLTRLNGKPTRLVQSAWRPTKLTVHPVPYDHQTSGYSYHKNEDSKRAKAIELLQKYSEDKWIVFVHTKKMGHALLAQLRDRHEPAEFHSADLTRDNRLRLEDRFRHGDLRVVVATSTLAYGINMPARRVMVVGIHRGLEKVAPLDVLQMFGRAGRVGLDPEGDAYLLVPETRDPREFDRTVEAYSKPGLIESQLNELHTLAFHLTAEVAEGSVRTTADAVAWHARSLAAQQGRGLDQEGKVLSASRVMHDLCQCGVLKEEDGSYEATQLGHVASRLYYSPFDVADWASNFRWAAERDKHHNDDVVAWALGNVRSAYSKSYLPKEHAGDMGDLEWRLGQVGVDRASNLPPACLAFRGMIEGTKYRAMSSYQRQLEYDADRIMQAITMIDARVLKSLGKTYCDGLGMRLRYGCSWEEADLCHIPGVGSRRARQLAAAGVSGVMDVLENRKKVVDALGSKIAQSVIRGAKEVARKRGAR